MRIETQDFPAPRGDELEAVDIAGTAEELRQFALQLMDAVADGDARFSVGDTQVTIKLV
jgi:hypothetical protein